MNESRDEFPSFVPRYRRESDVPGQRDNALRRHTFRVIGDGRGQGRWCWSDPGREPLTKKTWPFLEEEYADVYTVQFLTPDGRPKTCPILIDPHSEPQPGLIDPAAYQRAYHRHKTKLYMRKALHGGREKVPSGEVASQGALSLARGLRERFLVHANSLLNVDTAKLPAELRKAVEKAKKETAEIMEIVEALQHKLARGRTPTRRNERGE